MKVVLTLSFCILSLCAFSQADHFVDFGAPTADEISMKDCSFDPGAGAVMLRKDATTIPSNPGMVVYYRYRLKILKSNAVDLANIKIRFYAFDEYEKIEDLRAVSINYDASGNKKITPLENKNIYRTKIDNYYSAISFSMPEVKEGTIIEYSYSSFRRSYKIIDNWFFQDEIPVLSSAFDYTIMPNSEFSYRFLNPAQYPLTSKNYKNEGRLYFLMNNIPGIRDEPFMDAKQDYMSRLELQMNYAGAPGDRERFVGTWPELTASLLRDDDFGKLLDHNISGTDKIIDKAKAIPDEKKRMEFLLFEVQQQMSPDNYIGVYAKDKLRLAWEKRRGSSSDINLILLNLLRASGISSIPLLVSDRDHGKVDTTHPFISQFSKVIAYVYVENKKYYLDASQPVYNINLIPEGLRNTTGYLVDRKHSAFVMLTDPAHYEDKLVNITATIDANGLMQGQAFIMDNDYTRAEKERELRRDKKQFIHAHFEEPYEKMIVDSIKVDNLEDNNVSLNQLISFRHQLEETGDYIMVQPNLFSGIEKNPFSSDKRHTDINFGRNSTVTFNELFDIPSAFDIESTPKDIFLMMQDSGITIKRNLQFSPDTRKMVMRIKLVMNRSHYTPFEYDALKDFFRKMYTILNEPIVLKRKAS